MGSGDTGFSAVEPLRKRRKDTQELYHRREEVERQIGMVRSLSNPQIFELLQTGQRSQPNYLFDETVVYLLRARRASGKDADVEELYSVLNSRIWRLLSKFRSKFNDETEFEDFGQNVVMAIVTKILNVSSDSADYAQVNFGDFAVTEAKGVWRGRLVFLAKEDQHIAAQRDGDEDGADPISEIRAGGASALEEMIAREAIGHLPEHLRTVAILLADGWKIESREPAEPTISRYMGVSSRTIRNWVNEAREILGEYRGESR